MLKKQGHARQPKSTPDCCAAINSIVRAAHTGAPMFKRVFATSSVYHTVISAIKRMRLTFNRKQLVLRACKPWLTRACFWRPQPIA